MIAHECEHGPSLRSLSAVNSAEIVLVASLALNGVLGFGYRVYRLSKGGPPADVAGQAILGLVLAVLAVLVGADVEWARWVALAYALIWGLIVMPVWILGVLLPLPPAAADYAFTAAYGLGLVAVAIGALLA